MTDDHKIDRQNGSKTGHIKIPMTLTIPDVVFIVAAVVSMVTAWGIFGTRMSVVEEKIIFISNNMKDIRTTVKDLKTEDTVINDDLREDLESLEIRLRNLEMNQAEIRFLLQQREKKGK